MVVEINLGIGEKLVDRNPSRDYEQYSECQQSSAGNIPHAGKTPDCVPEECARQWINKPESQTVNAETAGKQIGNQ